MTTDMHAVDMLLEPRRGSRPTTTAELPHSQLDQQPADSSHVDAILAEASTWPDIALQPSAISVEDARALTLGTSVTGGPPEAFLIGREFCHVHARGDFSLHAMLPVALAEAAERAGWAEPHYLARIGRAPATLVMLYAPRDDEERGVVLGLVRASYEFAAGFDHTSTDVKSSTAKRTVKASGEVRRVAEKRRTTMSIRIVAPNGGEQSGGGPIRCRIIEDGSHTEHRLGLIEAVVPPGPASPPQHVHHDHDETFIVTQGKLTFTSGSDSVDVETGSCVTVPAGTPHTFCNPFDDPASFICTLTPDLYVEYFRDLSKLPLNEQGFLEPADIAQAMAKYGTEVIR